MSNLSVISAIKTSVSPQAQTSEHASFIRQVVSALLQKMSSLPVGLDCTVLLVVSFSKSLEMYCLCSASFALEVPVA